MSLLNDSYIQKLIDNGVNVQVILNVLEDLDNLPESISQVGIKLGELEIKKAEVQKRLNTLNKALEFTEASALLYPDKILKNEGERKAYIREKTENEQSLINDCINQKIEIETEALEPNREYKRLTDMFAAAKHKAALLSALLKFLGDFDEV